MYIFCGNQGLLSLRKVVTYSFENYESDIKSWTSTDSVLSTVCRYVMHGWPITVSDENLFPCKHRNDDLSIEDGCIYPTSNGLAEQGIQTVKRWNEKETHLNLDQ